jgi:hypothetical protein
MMDILELDPGTLLVVGLGAAVVGSPEARRTLGRGVGWVAGTAWRVAGPVVMPVVDAGRDMAVEVRDSATHQNGASGGERATTERAGRTRRTAAASA